MKNTEKKRSSARLAARYGLLTALALIFSYIEAQVPPFFAVPGMKPGLTNVIVILALYKMGSGSAMGINVMRIVLVSLLFGGMMSMLYSLAGGMLSTLVMILLKKTGSFRLITVSIAGGIAHNVGQIIAAVLMMNTLGIGWYLAVLWFSGMASGAVIGLLGYELTKRMPDKLFE